MVFDPAAAPRERKAFVSWQEKQFEARAAPANQALHSTGLVLQFFEKSGSLHPARQLNAVVAEAGVGRLDRS